MQLLVSIHDVAPPFAAEVDALYRLCLGFGITPALLVVPNWHGDAPLTASPALQAWLRARADEGANVLLHGERHDEEGSARQLRDWMRAVGRTDREGEFLTLGAVDALARVTRGMRALRASGLDPVGFVPPAWLARPAHRRAVRDAGLPITEDAQHVWLTRRDVGLAAPVIRWSARTLLRAGASCMVALVRDRVPPRSRLLRIALHPRDVHSPATRDSVERTLERCCRERRPVSYAQLALQDNLGSAA
jgi:predicted deacetylase